MFTASIPASLSCAAPASVLARSWPRGGSISTLTTNFPPAIDRASPDLSASGTGGRSAVAASRASAKVETLRAGEAARTARMIAFR